MGDNVLRFRILGQLQVWDGDGWVGIPAAQQRAVLAILLCEAGQVVSTDRLVEELWGEDPPGSAVNTIQAYILRLRRMLGDRKGSVLATRRPGYVIVSGGIDRDVFERHAADGLRALAEHRFTDAVRELSAALELWRGPALADVPATDTVTTEAARLEQRRLSVVEGRIDAELELGHHQRVVGELEQLVAEHPLRERLRERLMLALYRCGRRADALEVYRQGRTLLIDELGIEPGPQLQQLEQAILSDDPALAGPATPPGRAVTPAPAQPPRQPAPGPAQLPAASATFVGRQDHLRRLDRMLAGGDDAHAATVPIAVIAGPAGVGKTALAIQWAHRARAEFPDGQLYIDLRGHATDAAVRPLDALVAFLMALGVAPERVPADIDQAAALYRTMLADKRMLVLLDNASSPEHVRPLLPGGGGCLVLVTSRQRLSGLIAREGAHRLVLDVLAPAESHALLERMLGADRLSDEPEEAEELARLCGHLPLALRIAAANVSEHPSRSLAEHNKLMRADRLSALAVEGDEQAAVRNAFRLSYAALPEEARRLFRLLGVMPGQDATVDVAAALADISTTAARRLVGHLHDAHLLTLEPSGRMTFHDLLRLYAGELAEQEETAEARDAALTRLFRYYVDTADAAARLLYPDRLRLPSPPRDTAPEQFTDTTQARAWLDAERANLVALIEHAATHGPHELGWVLADTLRGYFWLSMRTVDWMAAATSGLAAATFAGDVHGQAAAHLSLADAHRCQGRYAQSIAHYEEAKALAARADWTAGQAAALGNLGNTYWRAGRLHEAAQQHTLALELDRQTGRLPGQAACLANLGNVYHDMGRLREAATYLRQALELDTQLDATWAYAIDMAMLGDVLYGLGDLGQARSCLDEALVILREYDDRDMEAMCLRALAAVQGATGDLDAALETARSALAIARVVGNRRTEADIMNVAGGIHMAAGRLEAAADVHRQAFEMACENEDRYPEIAGLVRLATVERLRGTLATARHHGRRALALARPTGYRMLEADALTTLAAIAVDAGDYARGLRHAQIALETHRDTGQRLGEARTLLVMGDAAEATNERCAADDHRREALKIFRACGAAAAAQVEALLDPAPASEPVASRRPPAQNA